MEGKVAQNALIKVLYFVLNDVNAPDAFKQQLTQEVLLSVYLLAKKHDLAHLLSSFIYKNKIEVDPELKAKLQQHEFLSVYRCEQMKYTLQEISQTLNQAQIAHIPLKGSVLRSFYPQEHMRTSCDIDVLIHPEDLNSAVDALKAKGYTFQSRNYHDVSMFSANKIHLELHFNIQENMDNLDAVLKDAWQYASSTAQSRYDFTKEFFAFHMYAHMAYHFLSGGCGIRSLIDIWVMEHKMGITYTNAEPLLKKAGIYKFAVQMSRLANQCFSKNNADVFSNLVLQYIYNGGVYGSAENNAAIYKSKNNSSWSYVLDRLFLPYRDMTVTYPILKKFPFLLPFFWVVRWIKTLFGGKTKSLAAEVARVHNVSDQKIAEIKEIRSKLGL